MISTESARSIYESTSAFIVLLQKPEELKMFEQLIPGLMSTLSTVEQY